MTGIFERVERIFEFVDRISSTGLEIIDMKKGERQRERERERKEEITSTTKNIKHTFVHSEEFLIL